MFEFMATHSDGHEMIKVDRAAWDSKDRNQLMMMSFVSTASVVKTVIAAVRSKKQSTVFKYGPNRYIPLHDAGYQIAHSRLPKYDQVHVVMQVNNCRVLLGDVREQLGRFLMSKQTTTPMLASWLPTVIDHILEIQAVSAIDSLGIDAYKIEFDDNRLDEIVSKLLRERKIRIHVSKQPC